MGSTDLPPNQGKTGGVKTGLHILSVMKSIVNWNITHMFKTIKIQHCIIQGKNETTKKGLLF